MVRLRKLFASVRFQRGLVFLFFPPFRTSDRMQEYSIHRSNRRCQKSDRPFQPGERYCSAIIQRGSELIRVDMAHEHWTGPSETTVGWWWNQMPDRKPGNLTLAPASVLLDTLEKLCEAPDDSDVAYLLALLLIRRRILNDDDSAASGSLDDDRDSLEHSHLQLTHPSDGREFSIPICSPSHDQIESIEQRLTELLYCES
jgi:hypothetical protein